MLNPTHLDAGLLPQRAGTPRPPVSLASLPGPLFGLAQAAAGGGYGGPERRSGPHAQPWLAQMLDEVDYGMLLLRADASLLHANKAARRDLAGDHPLQLVGGQLQPRSAADLQPLRDALAQAAQRGLRRLLKLGDGPLCCPVAVVPLPMDLPAGQRAVLLMLGKRHMCEVLSVEGFARSQGLTLAETQVLKGLCDGLPPLHIAQRHQVALSTVRTQIGSIRAKTGAASIRALVQMVAQLPPLVGALGGSLPRQPLAA